MKVNYRGVDVYAVGPNSQGFVMIQALNILEGFNLKYMGHNTAPYLHIIAEALKLAMADRNEYVGDPKFILDIPMDALLSKEYAAERRRLIDPHRAIVGEAPFGNPTGSPEITTSVARYAYNAPMPTVEGTWTLADEEATLGLTTYLNVVDKDHNMVSITSSNLSGWGNGMVVEGAGFLLNNRMNYFYDDPSDVNALVPGKRTRQTINPQLAMKGRQALDGVRDAGRRHTAAVSAPVLPEPLRVRHGRPASARAAGGDQQQLQALQPST